MTEIVVPLRLVINEDKIRKAYEENVEDERRGGKDEEDIEPWEVFRDGWVADIVHEVVGSGIGVHYCVERVEQT